VNGHLFTASVNNVSQASAITWIDDYASPVINGSQELQFNQGGFDISSIYVDPHDPAGATIYATVQRRTARWMR